jgi:hypothetical protein
MSSNLGGWEIDFMQPQYVQTPVISQFIKKENIHFKQSRFFSTLFWHIAREGITRLTHCFGTEKELNVAIGYPELPEYNDKNLDNLLLQLLRQEVKKVDPRFRANLFFCDINQLEPGDQGLLSNGKRIHVLLEQNNGKIPLWMMDFVNMQKLVIFNGPLGQFMTNKLSMALLSTHQDSDIFNNREREIIKKYIPWTRKTEPGTTTFAGKSIEMESFLLRHKDRLVLKPADGLGGVDVTLGKSVSPGQWKTQVENALKHRTWVVQEYLESSQYMLQHGEIGSHPYDAVWGLFVFGKTGYAGGFVRILPDKKGTGVINYHQGAEETLIIEVE